MCPEVKVAKNTNPLASLWILQILQINLELAYGFLPKNLRFIFPIRKHLTKVLDFWLADSFHQDFKNLFAGLAFHQEFCLF